MKKLIGILLVIAGVGLALYGWNEYHEVGNKLMSGLQKLGGKLGGNGLTENMKSIAMMVVGGLAALAGAVTFLKK